MKVILKYGNKPIALSTILGGRNITTLFFLCTFKMECCNGILEENGIPYVRSQSTCMSNTKLVEQPISLSGKLESYFPSQRHYSMRVEHCCNMI